MGANLLEVCKAFRGVAQLVARMAGGHEAVGSSPATPTKKARPLGAWLLSVFRLVR